MLLLESERTNEGWAPHIEPRQARRAAPKVPRRHHPRQPRLAFQLPALERLEAALHQPVPRRAQRLHRRQPRQPHRRPQHRPPPLSPQRVPSAEIHPHTHRHTQTKTKTKTQTHTHTDTHKHAYVLVRFRHLKAGNRIRATKMPFDQYGSTRTHPAGPGQYPGTGPTRIG